MILTYIPNSQPQHGIKDPLQICNNLQDKLSVYFAFAHVGTAAQCIIKIRIINDCQKFLPFAPSKFLYYIIIYQAQQIVHQLVVFYHSLFWIKSKNIQYIM